MADEVVNAADYGLHVTATGPQNVRALQLALDAAAKAGGGTVVVGRGAYDVRIPRVAPKEHATQERNPLLPRDFTLPRIEDEDD